jgi:hypothetical protein
MIQAQRIYQNSIIFCSWGGPVEESSALLANINISEKTSLAQQFGLLCNLVPDEEINLCGFESSVSRGINVLQTQFALVKIRINLKRTLLA